MVGRKKKSRASTDRTVAVRPAPRPAYQELTSTATRNNTEERSNPRRARVTSRASPTEATAMPYRITKGCCGRSTSAPMHVSIYQPRRDEAPRPELSTPVRKDPDRNVTAPYAPVEPASPSPDAMYRGIQ